ncbi:MAG: ferritin-like protein [Acidimicrobiia bacterium]|nr:ferritin-like protein [Acidimicrobiia bacterium]
MPIDSIQDLREHIELAIKVELTTIPPYLYAMYSIEDQSSESALLIRSIVAEEMLHAALAANLLLAVGGRPDFTATSYIPRYPSDVPHHRPPLRVDLAPCSLDLVKDLFMRIEQPEIHGAPDQPDEFETLGQFYHALENGFRKLNKSGELFANTQEDCQLSDPSFYAPVAFDAEDSGGLMLVNDVETAIEAIEIIVHQGEGLSDERWADPAHQELTHFYKLLRIYEGDSPLGAIIPMPTNPTTSSYPEAVRPVSDLFNAAYRYVYWVLDALYGPDRDKASLVGDLYALMANIMSRVAHYLTTLPIGDGQYAGPTFEAYEFTGPDPLAELAELATRAAASHPDLSPVADWLGARA